MADIAQGIGFDPSNLPSYQDLVDKLGVSDELSKISQGLQTVQLTHSLLSNYKPYKDLTKTLSEAVFDPIKAKFTKTVSETAAKVAGKFDPTGEGNGVTSKLINLVGDNPEDLLKLLKNPKAGAKSLLNKAIENSDLSAEDKALAKAVSEGKIAPKSIAKKALQKAIDRSDLPDEVKGLARSATEGKIPNAEDAKNLLGNIIDKSDLSDDVKALAKAAASGSKKTFMNAAKDNISKAIDNSNLPDDVKVTAKSAISGGNLTDEAKSALNTAIDGSDLAPEIKSFSKAIVSGNKQNLADQVSSTLNGIVEKSNLSPEVQTLAKSVTRGRSPTVDEAKSAMASILPESIKSQIPGVEDITQIPTKISAKALQFAELPKTSSTAVEDSIGKMPAALVDNLRQAGVSDLEIAANKSIDFAKIAKQAPLRLLDPSEITSDAPDFDLADAQRSYRASKYLERLSKPAADTGMGPGGDSTLARLFKAEDPIKDIKQYAPKTKRDIRDAAKQRKAAKTKPPQEEAGPSEEPKTTTDVIDQPINQNRVLSDEALTPYIEKLQSTPSRALQSEIEPASVTEEVPKTTPKVTLTEDEGEGLSFGDIAGGVGDVAGGALGAFGLAQSIEQKNKPQEIMQGTQLGISEGGEAALSAGEAVTKGAVEGGEVATKALSTAGKLQETTDESLAGDEDPIGAGVSAILEIATLATMLGGIFAPKQFVPKIVGGYQSGV